LRSDATSIAAGAADVAEEVVTSPFTWLQALSYVKPETLLMVIVLYILVKPELSGYCIGG